MVFVETPAQSPDHHGGRRAWRQVLVGHLVMFNSFGLIQSFGIFQPAYEVHLNRTPFAVSWIGSVHIFLVYFIGTFSGRALDAGHYRNMLGVGLMIQLVGLLAASSSETYPMAFAFHGVFQGIGHGLMFCPSVTNTALFFGRKNRMLAMSITGSGAATGGIIFPAIASLTLERLGVEWTLRIFGFVVLGTSLIIFLLARPHDKKIKRRQQTNIERSQEKKSLTLVDWKAFRDPVYALFVVAMFFIFTALWIPFFYIRDFTSSALHIPRTQSLILVLLMNACGIPGRILPALLADRRIGTINTYILILLVMSITILFWPLVMSSPGMYVWACAYGFCAGGTSSFLQAGIASLQDGPDSSSDSGGERTNTRKQGKLGVRIGMAFSIVGFAGLIGGPVGGQLIKAGQGRGEGGQFLYLQLFTGGIMVLGCVILVCARWVATGALWRRV
ncbi:MFS general substrate transporter [Lophiostoma macrostomum CBS 122681]|uniref:MFS general substrate transporter n=1 Tax=Lophiostoma macrostomum CBS 122681 TaxID=1314788 RepID=A0A6A6STM1_9PLEO|nr:MFS general substrate transporter [Lophiostoma macrostomum CBS 122681]